MKLPSVLTIAGSDSSGGAGIQADIKTITAHKLFATSAITALTAQNTTGVFAIHDVPPDFVAAQLDAIFSDIPPAAVKIGMVSSPAIIDAIADAIVRHHAANIVVDPVMVATSGARLIAPDAADTLVRRLFPLATLITPNIPEAEVLARRPIRSRDDMILAAQAIAAFHSGAILVKGGHLVSDATDLLWSDGAARWFSSPRIETTNTHGTGCTLSSAIACNLALGRPLPDAIRAAKSYLTQALASGLDLGHGSGPLDHTFPIPPAAF